MVERRERRRERFEWGGEREAVRERDKWGCEEGENEMSWVKWKRRKV